MNKTITTIILASWLTAANTGCGTLSSVVSDAGKIDWAGILHTAHTVYDGLTTPILKECAALSETDDALNAACTKLAEFDTTAQTTLALGDVAVATGQDVAASVDDARKRVDALKAAFEAFLGVKAQAAQRSARSAREVAVARSTNPYRLKAAGVAP